MKIVSRGYLLVVVIGVGSLLFLAGIAAVSLSSQDALQQRHLERTAQARCAAEVGIAEALAELDLNPAWKGEVGAILADGGRYNLDFDPGQGLNNLTGSSSQTVDGHDVPVGTACLVSQGDSQGCHVENSAIVSLDELLFSDDFSSPATGWESNHPNLSVYLLGKWVLDLKLLTQTYLIKGDENWRNYTYEASVLLSQGSNLGFVVRASGPPAKMSGYVVGYSLLESTLNGGTFHLSRMENGVIVERLQQRRASDSGLLGGLLWLLNLYHTYKITVNGDTIIATVDGKEIINATLEHPIKSGRVGILPGLLSLMLIDRVSVRSLPEVRSRWRTL